MGKYSFGGLWGAEIGVECPELDAFIRDLTDVCKKHGVGFDLDYDERTTVRLVPFERSDFSFVTDDLDRYKGGISWLDIAKAEWEALKDDEYKAAQSRHDAERQAQEAVLVQEGMVIGGQKYRLVAE